MQRVKLQRVQEGRRLQAGQWGSWSAGGGRALLTVACPKCGGIATLSDHEIAESGDLEPSLVCPYQHCDFHAYATLEGWKP